MPDFKKITYYIPPVLLIVDLFAILLTVFYIAGQNIDSTPSFQTLSSVFVIIYTFNMIYVASKNWE